MMDFIALPITRISWGKANMNKPKDMGYTKLKGVFIGILTYLSFERLVEQVRKANKQRRV